MDNNDCRWPVAIGTTESGEMILYDNGIISNCKLCRVIH